MKKFIILHTCLFSLLCGGIKEDIAKDTASEKNIQKELAFIEAKYTETKKICSKTIFTQDSRNVYTLKELESIYDLAETANNRAAAINQSYRDFLNPFIQKYKSTTYHSKILSIHDWPSTDDDNDWHQTYDACPLIDDVEEYKQKIKQVYQCESDLSKLNKNKKWKKDMMPIVPESAEYPDSCRY